MVIKVLFIVKIEENKERTKNVRVNSLTLFYKNKIKRRSVCSLKVKIKKYLENK